MTVRAGLRPAPSAPLPFGAEAVAGGVRFSLPAPRARAVELLLFQLGAPDPHTVLAFPDSGRRTGVWTMTVAGPLPETFEYAYRVHGDGSPDPVVLSDPYARAYGGRDEWGKGPDAYAPYRFRARFSPRRPFDWGSDQPPRIPRDELVIYETHVRGFTRHASSGVREPGTYAGLVEKIPHLERLGITCVELLPVFEFDERDNPRRDPATGRPLVDFWGYNPLGFFAPKAAYAAGPEAPATEFKTMVKALHAAGIAVVLDVVFNHTAEGGRGGPTIALRGLDESAYYVLDEAGRPRNLTGSGNTVAANAPAARRMILNSLRYWATEFRVDGFRFDEASILTRDASGEPLESPPILADIAGDPALRDLLLIAEPWDPALDLVGRFPGPGRWSEWNPRFRDALRRFLRGDPHSGGELATRMAGSPDLYRDRGFGASVNYVAAHDGFTLRDLVTYDGKHNDANGEDGLDGADDELSWNCGAEGPTDRPEVLALRERQERNALLLLLLSQGTPMLLAGDELGRSQAGNSNAYCHDSALTWLDWGPDASAERLTEFTRRAIALRRAHPAVREGFELGDTSGSDADRPLLVSLRGRRGRQGRQDGPDEADLVYVVANAGTDPVQIRPPEPPNGLTWALAADTALADVTDSVPEPGHGRLLGRTPNLTVAEHSVTVLVATAATENHRTEPDERERTDQP